jgi:hypothetical protein
MRVSVLILVAVCAGCGSSAARVDTTLGAATPPAGVITSSTGADVRLSVDTDPSEHLVKGSLKSVWAALADVYESLPVPLDFADPRGYRAGNTHWITRSSIGSRRMSTFLRCGIGPAGPLADSHRISMQVLTELKSISSDTTAVLTQVNATAAAVDGSSTAPVTCATTGALESSIVAGLRKKLPR